MSRVLTCSLKEIKHRYTDPNFHDNGRIFMIEVFAESQGELQQCHSGKASPPSL